MSAERRDGGLGGQVGNRVSVINLKKVLCFDRSVSEFISLSSSAYM